MDIFADLRAGDEKAFYANLDKVDINVVNDSGSNLLHVAIARKNVKIALDLITRGIDVNRQNAQGQTPLHHAATFQLVELVQAIHRAGGKVSISDVHGNTPLWTAVAKPKRNHAIVKLLLDAGGDPAAKNKAGMSCLDIAKQINSEALVALLERRQA